MPTFLSSPVTCVHPIWEFILTYTGCLCESVLHQSLIHCDYLWFYCCWFGLYEFWICCDDVFRSGSRWADRPSEGLKTASRWPRTQFHNRIKLQSEKWKGNSSKMILCLNFSSVRWIEVFGFLIVFCLFLLGACLLTNEVIQLFVIGVISWLLNRPIDRLWNLLFKITHTMCTQY